MNEEPSSAILSFSGKYKFLSNFHSLDRAIFDDMRIPYYTVENAYQAQKSLDKRDRLAVQNLPPGKAKAVGRSLELRPDWNEVKRGFMLFFLLQKFLNNPDLRRDLDATGTVKLIEGNHWGDVYWGTVNGRGKNHLGKLLMIVRDVLRDPELLGGIF